MSSTYTSSSLSSTVPALGDSANIVTAFQDYHASIAPLIAVLGRANTFTSPITMGSATQLLFNDATGTEGRFLASSGVMYVQAGTSSADTSAELRITRNNTTTTNISALKLYADVISTNGSLFLVAGTSSLAPLVLTSGTKLTNPAAGAFEYDGSVIYATPKVNNTTAGRGLLPAQNILVLDSTYTQSVSSTGSIQTGEYYALGNKTIYLAASQNYLVEMNIMVSSTVTVGAAGGTGTFAFYLRGPSNTSWTVTGNSAVNTAWTTGSQPVSEFYSNAGSSTASKTLHSFSSSGSSQTRYVILQWRGVISTTAAGLFGPTVYITAASSGGISTSSAVTVQVGSFCKVTPLGSTASAVNIGGWS